MILLAGFGVLATLPSALEAQGRGRGNGGGNGHGGGGDAAVVSTSASVLGVDVTFSVADRDRIRSYYASHPVGGVESLPPGIRRNLARGKPLPPGIAKRTAPAGLRSTVVVPDRYEIVEVGLDVFLVEVATGVIHDVLMDVIR